MTTVIKGLSGVETCGGGDLTLVTGYYRPGRRRFKARWSFILGRFHRDRLSWAVSAGAGFPNRRDSTEKEGREWGIGSWDGGIVSLPHQLLPNPIPLRKIRLLKKAGKFAFLMV